MNLEWDESLSVGNDLIDADHQKLFEIINRLRSQDCESREALTAILNELVDYSVYHFGREEELMAKNGYTRLGKHQEEHGYFIAKVGGIGLQLERDPLDRVRNEASEFLSLWLSSHIRTSDKDYVMCLSGAPKKGTS